MMKTMRIAAIPGDGIGKEVLPEGIRVLQAAAERWGFALSFEQMEWASCEYYSHHGKMMPDDWHEQLSRFDAIYFGAVGWPDTVPDHISGNDSNLLIVFYVQIMPDDFVMQLHRF